MSMKSKTTVCRNCNAQITKGTKICPSCGARNKKPFYKKWWFILLVIVVAIAVISSIGRKKFNWNDVELKDRLPKPKSNVGRIWSNEINRLSIEVEKISKGKYRAYVEDCKSMGYTLENEETAERYKAFDEEGYGLELSYFDETMHIALDAPQEMGTLNWPQSEIAKLLPLPKSTIGKVSTDTADGCYIYVGETTIDDFNAYADACSAQGFSVDYERGDNFYNAEDANGNQLMLSYQGNKVMIVQILKPDEIEEVKASEEPSEVEGETTPTETENVNAEDGLVDGIRPEFKEAMDSYEIFMNEYCEFMKKYGESDGTDISLITDYTEYMKRYAEVAEDFEKWDDEDINAAETAYYLEVQTRINTKLLEVAEN